MRQREKKGEIIKTETRRDKRKRNHTKTGDKSIGDKI